MKIRFSIWVIFIAAVTGLIGLADAQSPKPGALKTITLETGEVVPDLTGEWNAAIDNFGRFFRGPTSNVIKITQEGNLFKGVRMEAEAKRAKGTMFMQGEVDKDGFKSVYFIDLRRPAAAVCGADQPGRPRDKDRRRLLREGDIDQKVIWLPSRGREKDEKADRDLCSASSVVACNGSRLVLLREHTHGYLVRHRGLG